MSTVSRIVKKVEYEIAISHSQVLVNEFDYPNYMIYSWDLEGNLVEQYYHNTEGYRDVVAIAELGLEDETLKLQPNIVSKDQKGAVYCYFGATKLSWLYERFDMPKGFKAYDCMTRCGIKTDIHGNYLTFYYLIRNQPHLAAKVLSGEFAPLVDDITGITISSRDKIYLNSENFNWHSAMARARDIAGVHFDLSFEQMTATLS